MNSKTIRTFNQTSLMVISMMGSGVLMTACTSLPSKTSLSPQQAVINGYQQLYSTPSYQFSGQFRVNQLGFNRDPKILKAAAELEQQKKAKEKQQLLQRYIDELTADAQSEDADSADSASAKKPLSASQQAKIRQQAEHEVEALYDEDDKKSSDDPYQAALDTLDALSDLDSDEQPGDRSSSEADTATSRLAKLNKDKLIEDLIYTYTQRYRLNYQGTMDLRHGQIAFSPEMRYDGSNMAGYVRIPLVFDLRQAHLYADLSALSPWLVQVKNDGKYSRFDLSAYKDKVDFKQLFTVLQHTTQASYQLPKAQQFRETDLTAQDKKQGAVRKVELNQPVAHRIADVATFLALNQNSLKQIVKTKAASSEQKANTQPATPPSGQPEMVPLISAEAASQLIAQDPQTYQHILQTVEEKIDPASQLKQTILLDSKGRVLQTSTIYDLLFKPSRKGQMGMQLSHQVNFADYGQAEVAFKPNASNWVDAKANMQDTLFGSLISIFSKKSLGADDMLKSFGKDDSAPDTSTEQ